jgi:hypothetical protein
MSEVLPTRVLGSVSRVPFFAVQLISRVPCHGLGMDGMHLNLRAAATSAECKPRCMQELYLYY